MLPSRPRAPRTSSARRTGSTPPEQPHALGASRGFIAIVVILTAAFGALWVTFGGGIGRFGQTQIIPGAACTGDCERADCPEISSFTSTPASIPLGSHATLSWATVNTSMVQLTVLAPEDIQRTAVATSGEVTVAPTGTRTYQLQALPRSGSACPVASQTVTVTVTLPAVAAASEAST